VTSAASLQTCEAKSYAGKLVVTTEVFPLSEKVLSQAEHTKRSVKLKITTNVFFIKEKVNAGASLNRSYFTMKVNQKQE
jgi:hypothetical protein